VAAVRHDVHDGDLELTTARERTTRRTAGESGQGLTEFALVFPIIVLLIMGIFDLGRAVYAYNALSNAAREGARVGSVNQLDPVSSPIACNEDKPIEDPVNPDWWSKACAAATAISLGITPSSVTVSYSAPGDESNLVCNTANGQTLHVGCIVTVTVTYSWAAMTPVIGNLVGPIAMSSTSQIPIERVFP
jgi:Flp pilus assembly protein TadG